MSIPNPDISKVKSKRPDYYPTWNNGNWGPKGWFRYKVGSLDNWWNIAQKDGWADPWDLIAGNFKTRDAKEVNWFLRNFVGCKYATKDGLNHIFTDNLKPGYIYTKNQLQPQDSIPPMPVPPPTPEAPDDEIKLVRPGVWVGVGAKAGAFAGVGYDRTEAVVFSSDFSDVYHLSIDTLKLGLGAGAGAGALLVIASGLPTLGDLKYCVITGTDWNLSIGPAKFKALAKGASVVSGIRRLSTLVKTGEFGAEAVSEGITGIKYVLGLMGGMSFGCMPTVTLVDIPFAGMGADISVYSGRSTFSVQTIYESDESLIGIG